MCTLFSPGGGSRSLHTPGKLLGSANIRQGGVTVDLGIRRLDAYIREYVFSAFVPSVGLNLASVLFCVCFSLEVECWELKVRRRY